MTRSGKTDDTRLHASKTRSTTDTPKTLYEILGVSSDATRSEIKRAYIALARQTHPDAIRQQNSDKDDSEQGEGDGGAEPLESFDTIAGAYQILTIPLERKRYDRKLRAQEFTQDAEQAIDNFGERMMNLVTTLERAASANPAIPAAPANPVTPVTPAAPANPAAPSAGDYLSTLDGSATESSRGVPTSYLDALPSTGSSRSGDLPTGSLNTPSGEGMTTYLDAFRKRYDLRDGMQPYLAQMDGKTNDIVEGDAETGEFDR